MSHRKGFTLAEALIVVVIVGILVLIGYPKVSRAMVTTNVRGARTTIVNMIAKARAVATQSNRNAQLEFVGNKVLITATPRRLPGGGTKDTIGTMQDLNAIYGVTVTPPAGPIKFDPRGIGSGFGAKDSASVTKSGKRQAIVIDMLGRVQ